MHSCVLPRTRLALLALAWTAVAYGAARVQAGAPDTWLSPELRRSEAERQSLTEQLSQLPTVRDPQFTERLGYHSGYAESPDTVEWFEMDLHRAADIDAVVLVPATSNAGSSAAPGYGFPVRFRVELSDSADHAGRTVIADYTAADFPNPGALPVFFRCAGKRARFVRVTATRLFQEGDRALLALGEMIVLHGQLNLAARVWRGDFTYSRTHGALPVWGLSNLVDGHSVLGPPEGEKPSQSLGFSCKRVSLAKEPHPAPRWVQVDLGEEMPVDEVRLFPAHPPEYAHRPGYGFPPVIKVELSNDPDFRESVELTGFREGSGAAPPETISPGDNVMAYTATDETARFVRVTAPRLFNSNGLQVFALAELQVWSGNRNVALDQPVTAYDSMESDGWSRAALVDGFTSRAEIVDWPQWLEGLSRRREVEQRLAVLDTRQAFLRAQWRTIGWWTLAGLVATALLVMGGVNLRHRRMRRLELAALHQRISQDLHDEIGSSLGGIMFMTDEAMALTGDEAVQRELGEIRNTAREALDAMRDIVSLAQKGTYGNGDLTEHLREIAGRMLRGISWEWHAEAREAFDCLSMDTHRDLVLMFKEALHNLARHAGATKAEIAFAQNGKTLRLTVRDNGRGFDPAQGNGAGMGLANLRHRAGRHGGTIEVTSAPQQGTMVAITLPRHG